MKGLARCVFAACFLLAANVPAEAQMPAAPEPPPPTGANSEMAPWDESTASFQKVLSAIVLEHLPETYEDNRHWGQTTRRWDGLHLQLDDFELKTRRRFKEVNHGDWTSYRLELVEPEKQFEFRLEKPRRLDDGRLALNVAVASPLACQARYARWQKGVQLLSVQVEATAKVELNVVCAVKAQLDATKFPPDVVLAAEALEAQIDMHDFRVQRVSKLGGEGAQLLGKAMRSVVERKVEDKREKLVEKINGQLHKHAEKLRFSLRNLATSQWRELVAAVPEGEPAATQRR